MAQARGSFATINMVGAFIVIGVFLYWLSVTTEPTEVAVAEEGPEIPMVDVSVFAEAPAMYSGTDIELLGVEVVDNVGSQAFFFGVPGGDEAARYLARLQPGLVAGGLVVLPGDRANLIGTVRVMTDSVFNAWTQEGIFVGGLNTQRDAVGAVAEYFETREASIVSSGTAPPAGATSGQ